MLTNQGISVGSWVDLHSSCEIRSVVDGDDLHLEFGPGSVLGLNLDEGMVDRLAAVLTEAQGRFRELGGSGQN